MSSQSSIVPAQRRRDIYAEQVLAAMSTPKPTQPKLIRNWPVTILLCFICVFSLVSTVLAVYKT